MLLHHCAPLAPSVNRHQNLGSKEQSCSLLFLGHGPYWRRGEYEVFLQPLYTPIQHTHTLSAHLLASPSHTTVATALKPQFPLPFVGVLCCYIIIPVSTPADEGKRSTGQCTCTGECTCTGQCFFTGYLPLSLFIILLLIILFICCDNYHHNEQEVDILYYT